MATTKEFMLLLQEREVLVLPKGFIPLHVAFRDKVLTLCAVVSEHAPREPYMFRTILQGRSLPLGMAEALLSGHTRYLASVEENQTPLRSDRLWHVFYDPQPIPQVAIKESDHGENGPN